MITLKSILESRVFNEQALQQAVDVPGPLYHATFEEFVNSIMRSGLVPRANNPNFEESDKNYIYLTPNAQAAKSLIEDLFKHSKSGSKISRLSGKVNVLTINVKKLDKSKFFEDPASGLLQFRALMYSGKIPASYIEDWGD